MMNDEINAISLSFRVPPSSFPPCLCGIVFLGALNACLNHTLSLAQNARVEYKKSED